MRAESLGTPDGSPPLHSGTTAVPITGGADGLTQWEIGSAKALSDAGYATGMWGAEWDFKEIWGAKHEGEFGHIAVAVLRKDPDGELKVERHDSTAKRLAWGGAIVGATLYVIAPPVGIAAVAAGGGALAGIGGLVGHFWHNIPEDDAQEAGRLLQNGESGLIVVAVNWARDDISHLLTRAEQTKIINTVSGDLDATFATALKRADNQSGHVSKS